MTLALPLVGSTLGPTELILIVLVLLLLVGGKKLPEMARGTGRALRIFKAETKGLMDDDDDDLPAGATQAQLPQQGPAVQPAVQPMPAQQQWPQQQVQPQPWTQEQQALPQAPMEQPPRTDS